MHLSAVDFSLDVEDVEPPLRSETSAAPKSLRRSLLLVDDEPAVARMIAHVAEECGYRAKYAISAAAFRAEYEIEPPEIVLLDLSLPGGDGVELLRFLAEKCSQSIIFIVSGFDRRVLEAARRLGEGLGLRMGGTLTKPVFLDDFEQAISNAQQRFQAKGGMHDAGRVCLGA